MATKRNVDLITEAFSDVMTARRKYELKKPNGELLKELYFPPSWNEFSVIFKTPMISILFIFYIGISAVGAWYSSLTEFMSPIDYAYTYLPFLINFY